MRDKLQTRDGKAVYAVCLTHNLLKLYRSKLVTVASV